MRLSYAALLLAALPAFAADKDFNGRWDITTTSPRPRAWWVELNGVGTATPDGKFVSAYGGDMNTISTITVQNGELTWEINAPQNPNSKGPAGAKSVYRAKLVNGKLEGTMQATNGQPIQWTA